MAVEEGWGAGLDRVAPGCLDAGHCGGHRALEGPGCDTRCSL